MTPEQARFVAVRDQLLGMARHLSAIDVRRFLAQVEYARRLSAAADPGLARKGAAASMELAEEVARAAIDFKDRLNRRGVLNRLAMERSARRRARGGA
jgi:hypothetical protein